MDNTSDYLLDKIGSWFGTEVSNRNQLARHLAINLKELVLIADGLTKVSTYSRGYESQEEADMAGPEYDSYGVSELVKRAESALKKLGGEDV